MLCSAMSCHVMPCYAMTCNPMLSFHHAMLCYATLNMTCRYLFSVTPVSVAPVSLHSCLSTTLKVMKSGKGPVTIQMSTVPGRIYFDRGFCGEIRIFSRKEGAWPWDQSDSCIAALTGRRCHRRTKAQIKGRIKEFRGRGGPNWDGGIWNMRRNGRQQCNRLDAG